MQLDQHQTEIAANFQAWQRKPLLQSIYARFYARIIAAMDLRIPGRVVEIGSGIGNLKAHFPAALCTDLFPNPWLDMVCDGYELPFADATISHLVLFDVFHHLERPRAFLREARRVLVPGGRLILFEPYISAISWPVYGLLHHEPVGWKKAIDMAENPPSRRYYAAQGNATRLLFREPAAGRMTGWTIMRADAFAAFTYLFSGGYSKPAMYPQKLLATLETIDARLSRWPKLFGARCLVVLTPEPNP